MLKRNKTRICPKCHTPVYSHVKTCPECGTKLKKPFYLRWWFIAIVVVFVIGVISTISQNQAQKYDWDEIVLKDRLPKPQSNTGHIYTNDKEALSLKVEKTSTQQYNDYVEACQEMGYTIDSQEDGSSYVAFDDEGYQLQIDYYSDSMHIDLETPMEMGTLNWPQSDLASLLPLPASTIGKVTSDSSSGCYIYVGDTSRDDFNAYVEACQTKGFTVDYNKGDDYYYADDINGNHLSLSYEGNNVMSIQLRQPTETTSSEDNESTSNNQSTTVPSNPETSESQTLVDGMRPEFKTAMDNYESFMNEYCEFMEKYAHSDGTDASLLSDYADYLQKYADAMEAFEAWDNGEMNDKELTYYLEVQNRVTQKLLETSSSMSPS